MTTLKENTLANRHYKLVMDKGRYSVHFLLDGNKHHIETYKELEEAKEAARLYLQDQRVRRANV